ncbi:MAG: LCP family protein [Propionibacteriaceae bacterium]|nr:LCP family protein [Propionibacteriaceae bacterium]
MSEGDNEPTLARRFSAEQPPSSQSDDLWLSAEATAATEVAASAEAPAPDGALILPKRIASLDLPQAVAHSVADDPAMSDIFVSPAQAAAAQAGPAQAGPDFSAAAAYAGRRVQGDEPVRDKASAGKHALKSSASGFGQAVGWTILGTVIPGLGLIRAGRKVTGILALVLFCGVGVTLGVFIGFNRMALVRYATNPTVLMSAAAVLLALALVWVLVIVGSHLSLRPAKTSIGQRVGGAALVGVLAMLVAAPMAVGANVAYTSSNLVSSVFKEEKSDNVPVIAPEVIEVDPWQDIPRLNVLILGGDSGTGRSEKTGMRADTVIVASIDTHTGATTLFSLPRQTARIPFPKDSPLRKYYPNGFYDGKDGTNAFFMLNAMYNEIPRKVPKDILGKTSNLGADVMKVGVGEALGLDISYYVVVNMDGFKEFINALGGVTLNVSTPIPIGGKKGPGYDVPPKEWIHPGPDQHFGGRLALWYARGRYGLDDYSRMERQRCVVNAVVKQADPVNVLSRFQAIADVSKKTLQTDVPQDMLPALVDLATRVQGTKLRSIVFINGQDGFKTGNPDWAKVRSRVKKTLKETDASNTTPTPDPSASATPSGSATPSKTATAKPKSDDLDSACGYHPEKYKEALKHNQLTWCERSNANYKLCFGKSRS